MTPRLSSAFTPVLLIGFGMLLNSCFDLRKRNMDIVRAEAYVPVYGIDPVKRSVRFLSVQPVKDAGKIYVWGNLLFQVDLHKGIHVIDYSDRSNPQKIGFIQVHGCNEVAVKGSTLITNNINDLVTIDVSNPAQPKELARIKNAFPNAYDYQYNYQPPERGKYYICPSQDKGDVVGWTIEKNIKGANCVSH
ncbi:MAG TPA: hypothetical protein VGD17_01260 [Chitinophagaceae bacterium]